MVVDAMITPICPFCSKPLAAQHSLYGYSLTCYGTDGHFYGALAATEEDARAIVLKPQKTLADALSARIALPLEQRRHQKLREKVTGLFAQSFGQPMDAAPKDKEILAVNGLNQFSVVHWNGTDWVDAHLEIMFRIELVVAVAIVARDYCRIPQVVFLGEKK